MNAGQSVLVVAVLCAAAMSSVASTEVKFYAPNIVRVTKTAAVHAAHAPAQLPHPDAMNIYLPKGTDWWNYFTGKRVPGGQVVGMPTKLDEFPLYVRAGSVIPYGPDVQWSDEKPLEDLEVVVYPGADGSFTLYEDEGDGYGYEQGRYTEIIFRWNDAARELTVEDRKGAYPGMLDKRRFNVRMQGSGTDGKSVAYEGRKVSVRL